MSAHTPGPWTVEPPNDGDISETDSHPRYKWAVRAPGKGSVISFQLCELSSMNTAELEADANLIAAAPDLLDALIAFEEIGNTMDVRKKISAAISKAKATGSQS